MTDNDMYFCERCHNTMKGDNFYGSNNEEKYPNKKLNICKKCITARVNNWEPDTYLWILQECDVPYIQDVWNNLMQKWAKPEVKVTGATIIGRYLSTMKIKQYKNYRWKDSEFLQQLADQKTEQAMRRQGYSAAEIAQTINTGKIVIPDKPLEEPIYASPSPSVYQDEGIDMPYIQRPQEDYFVQQNGTIDEENELTDEEVTMLRLKWGNTYKPIEWVQLEQLYQQMMESYDITAAGDINTLKLACKASLKANQLMDIGDIEGAQKMSKVYNDYMKAGKWTAAQNKTDESEIVDSVGELVALCERDGFFPRFYVDQPMDKVDRVIQDMQKYTHDLVTEETGLNNLIELAFQHMRDEEEAIKAASDAGLDNETAEEDRLFEYDKSALTDKDFNDFRDYEDENISRDAKIMKGGK